MDYTAENAESDRLEDRRVEADYLDELAGHADLDKLEADLADHSGPRSGGARSQPAKWKKRRRPPRRNRKPSAPKTHIGRRNNGRLNRL